MKGLEAAIRNALAKAGHTDAQMRARIYQSARSALESGLRKQGISDSAVVAQQRHRLEALIEEIEREERLLQTERMVAAENASRAAAVDAQPEPRHAANPAMDEQPAPAPEPVAPSEPDFPSAPVGRVDDTAEPPQAPSVEVDRGDHYQSAPISAAPDLGGVAADGRLGVVPHPRAETSDLDEAPVAEPKADHLEDRVAPPPKRQKKQKEKPRRRWRARLFSLVILIAFGAAAYWWVDSTGLLLSPQERDTSVPNPPPTASDEDFEAPGLQSFRPERGFGEGWETVYDPGDGTVERGADVSAEVRREGETQFLYVSAPAGGAESSITIPVPRDLLRQMAGNPSVIAISARGVSPDAQLSVTCDFGGSVDCGRHRFTLTDDNVDLIFEVEMPADAGNSGDGQLNLNVAAGGADGEMELYGVHVEPKGDAGDT
ncbi:hypothetical protein [Rhizobium sp. L1K21]|uniref:hypothetical protein n=1 Tax=Rhizobium sp. L1K21 TaxID=2954933 RepID=UPI002092EABE|nr:hypothetical protein [Rhizobium sp. L1K21]MCO6187225.1 hypothetical protein [Rhizobium sp. L1K21]